MKKLFVQCVGIVMFLFCFVPQVLAQEGGELQFVEMGNFAQASSTNSTLNTIGTGLDWITTPGRWLWRQVGVDALRPSDATNEAADFLNNPKEYATEALMGSIEPVLKNMFITSALTVGQGITSLVAMVGETFDWAIKGLTPTNDGQGDLNVGLVNLNLLVSAPWKIIRDVASIVLIFSLLYLGIKTILDGQGFADKKTLASIIVAAILLNFSLILTKDVAFYISNYVGQQVLDTAVLGNTPNQSQSFTSSILLRIGPQKLLDKGVNSQQDQMIASGWGDVFGYILQIIVLTVVVLVAAVIFFILIIQLLIRFLIFVILMITSPLGVIARTIPWLSGLGKMWWDELRKQTIYFPAFVFTMYIVFLIISQLGGSERSLQLAASSEGFFQGLTMFFINFLLIIGFLIILLIIPGKLSAGGSSIANKASDWTRKKVTSLAGRGVGAATFGTAAMVGRNTVGRSASKMLSSDKLKTTAQNAKGFKGSAARALLRRADKAQDYSFDARSTKLGGDFAKKHGLGEASKGWKSAVDSKQKALKEKSEKEKKLYGFDKKERTFEEDKLLLNKKTERDRAEGMLKYHKADLETMRSTPGVSDADIKNKLDHIKTKEKELEKIETDVGKLTKIGDSSYIEFLKTREKKSLNMYKQISQTQRKALEEIEKDINKEWKKVGMSKDRKKEYIDSEKEKKALFGDSSKKKPSAKPPTSPPSPSGPSTT